MFQICQKARNLCIQPRNEQGEYMAIMAILYTFTPQFLGAQTIYSPQMQRRHVSLRSMRKCILGENVLFGGRPNKKAKQV